MPHYQLHFGWCASEAPPQPRQIESSCPEEAAKAIKATAGRDVNIISITQLSHFDADDLEQLDDMSGTTREQDFQDLEQ